MDKSNDAKFMEKYLFHALTFERYVYIWEQALALSNKAVLQIQQQKRNCQAGLDQARNTLLDIDKTYMVAYEHNKEQKNKAKKNIIIMLLVVAALIVLSVIGVIMIISDREFGALLIFPLFFISSILPIVLIFLIYKFVKSKRDGEQYTKAKKEYDSERLSNDINNYKFALNGISSKEALALTKQNEIKKNLNYALDVRSKIYSLNVLDDSYRSLVATATLYQYLKSGICTTIKGQGGIYQTYLYHSQLGQIITQLSDINHKLNIVISNQRILYDEISKANGTLESIEKEVKEINQKTDDIKTNTKIALVAQQQTADAANYMAYMTWRNG